MGFDVAAASYDAFMGRYSVQLSAQLADLAGIAAGQRVLDVGSGPGALTAELVARIGAGSVVAVDPSPPFVEAVRHRHPGVAVSQASAEELPFADGEFDATLAQLVVHLMADSRRGLAEMRRVTRAGGVVAACVWDFAGDRAPLSTMWRAAHALDLDVVDESDLPGAREGHLAELFRATGLGDVVEAELTVSLEHATFEEWWEPYSLGVGPAGSYVAGLDEETRAALRDRCRANLPEPPFVLDAVAWAARGRA